MFILALGPPNLLFTEYDGAFLGLKRSVREVNYSSPSRAQVKNEWSYTSPPPVCLHGVKRDKIFFTMRAGTVVIT
jgi:hypothetical protein